MGKVVEGDYLWIDQAACADMDTEIFFRPRHYTLAVAVCGRCSVLNECRRANDRAERGQPFIYGVFGGETPKARLARRNGHAV